MSYSKTTFIFFIQSLLIIPFLLYFANITRKIEKENLIIKNTIDSIQDQININEIEYSLYSSYENLIKLQKIYFEVSENKNFENRIIFSQLKNKNIENIINVGIK